MEETKNNMGIGKRADVILIDYIDRVKVEIKNEQKWQLFLTQLRKINVIHVLENEVAKQRAPKESDGESIIRITAIQRRSGASQLLKKPRVIYCDSMRNPEEYVTGKT